jgi:lipopolysaccharide export LptBFGC system permease protein LptF
MSARNAPRIIQRYLLRELATIFGMSMLALTVLFMVALGIRAVQGGYSLRIILPWIFESVSYSFYFTVPLSLLVASTLGYGRFVADREYTAATASGVSPFHLVWPLLVLSGALSFLALATQGTVLPRAHYKQRNITRYLVKQLERIGDSKKGKLQIDKDDGMVYWDEIREGRLMRGVHIEKRLPLNEFLGAPDGEDRPEDEKKQYDDEIPIPPTYISAQSGVLEVDTELEVIKVTLFNVEVKAPSLEMGYLFPQAGIPMIYEGARFSEIPVQFPINEKDRREGDLSNSELVERMREHRAALAELDAIPAGSRTDEERVEAEKERKLLVHRLARADSQLWFRRALALSALTFGFLGFPISIAFRHSHRMVPLFVGVILVVALFYPLLLVGEALVKHQGIPAPFAMLGGNIILLSFGAFLCGKVVLR